MPRRACCLLATAAAFVPFHAHAGTQWLCGLSEDLVRLVCVAEADPRDEAAAAPAAGAGAATAVVNGTRFPLDVRSRYTVNLWSPPSDGATLRLLARATICYRSPGCEVTVALPAYLAASARPYP